MKLLLAICCVISAICASSVDKNYFNAVITDVEYSNIPTDKYQIKSWDNLNSILTEISSEIKTDLALEGTEVILNTYADRIFANLKQVIIHNGLDPIDLPDQHTGFNYTLIITYHGELDLTKGWLYDLSSMHRGGDVIATYSSNDKYLEVTVPIAFGDLQFSYDYNAKIMGLGPSGGLTGKVADIGIRVKIGFDCKNLVASMDEFYLTNSGHIEIKFNGNPLVDWLINLLTNVATALLKPVILLVVEGVIRGGLEAAVNAINDALGQVFNPPVPTTVPPFYFM